MGDTAPKFATVSGRLDVTGRPPSFQAVVAAIDANPQLVRWTAVYAQRNAELLLARLKPYPDVRHRRRLAPLQRDQRRRGPAHAVGADPGVRPEPGQYPVRAGKPGEDASRARGQPQHADRAGRPRLRLAAGLAARTGGAARDRDSRSHARRRMRSRRATVRDASRCSKCSTHRPASPRRGCASRRRSRTSMLRSPPSKGSSAIRSHWPGRARDEDIQVRSSSWLCGRRASAPSAFSMFGRRPPRLRRRSMADNEGEGAERPRRAGRARRRPHLHHRRQARRRRRGVGGGRAARR